MELFILAGGFGTRLADTIGELPKPLAPINKKPFLYYLLKLYIAQGLNNFVFLLHYKADLIIDYLNEEKHSGILQNSSVRYVVEPQPKGTGGAVLYAINELSIKNSFLVTNGDTILTSGVKEIISIGSPSIAVKKEKLNKRFGSVEIDNGRVLGFNPKGDYGHYGYINAGLYNLHPGVFSKRLDQNKEFSIESSLFPSLVKQNILNAGIIDGDFIDIGIPHDYKRFCLMIEDEEIFFKNNQFNNTIIF